MPKGVLTAICMVLVPFRKNKVPVRGGVPGNASKTMQNTAKTAKRRADDGPTLPEKLDKPYKKPGKTNEKLEKQCKTLEKPPENYTGKHKCVFQHFRPDSPREPQNTRFFFLLLGMGTPLGSTLNIA
jgi:hypothetical protein